MLDFGRCKTIKAKEHCENHLTIAHPPRTGCLFFIPNNFWDFKQNSVYKNTHTHWWHSSTALQWSSRAFHDLVHMSSSLGDLGDFVDNMGVDTSESTSATHHPFHPLRCIICCCFFFDALILLKNQHPSKQSQTPLIFGHKSIANDSFRSIPIWSRHLATETNSTKDGQLVETIPSFPQIPGNFRPSHKGSVCLRHVRGLTNSGKVKRDRYEIARDF